MSNTIEERTEKQILDYTASSDWDQIAKMTWTTAEMLEQMRVFAQQEVERETEKLKEKVRELWDRLKFILEDGQKMVDASPIIHQIDKIPEEE